MGETEIAQYLNLSTPQPTGIRRTVAPMGLHTQLVATDEEADAIAPEWDALAEAAGRPYCAPAWLLAWWRQVAPRSARLRLVVVRDEQGLVAIAPFYAARWRGLWAYSLLGTNVSSRVEPLARAGQTEIAARAIATALADADPPPAVVQLYGVPVDSRWPALLAAAWPGGAPFIDRRAGVAAPTVTLGNGDVDAWLAQRSSNFRSQMRRFRRRLVEAGAVFRETEDPAEIEGDLAEFERLHRLRFDKRGGSDAFPAGAGQMLVDAARDLIPKRRLRLAMIEVDGRAVAAHLFVAAGGEVSFWNTGFDDAYAQLRPSYVGLVDAVAAGFEGGYARLDLGAGAQDYKYRFADGEDQLEWTTLIPRGRRYALRRAAYAPDQARFAVSTRLSREQKLRIRELGGRLRAWRPGRRGGGKP